MCAAASAKKLLLITGGSRGLGKALLDQFRDEGWQVREWSRTGSGPEHCAANLRDLDSSPPGFAEDMTRFAAMAWDEVIAINNAAQIEPVGYAETLHDADLVASLNLNFTSGLRFMASFLRSFSDSPGRRVLVNISSGAATRPIPGWSLYCAAKAGTEHFIRSVASEQSDRPNPVLCLNINPGVMDTSMQSVIRGTPESRFPMVQRFVELASTGQLRDPGDIARNIRRILAVAEHNGATYDATQ